MRWRRAKRPIADELVVDEATFFNAGRVDDHVAILRAVGKAMPRPATVFIEGDSISEEVREFLRTHAVEAKRDDLSGTTWPRSQKFHVSLTDAFAEGLASLAERHAGPEICDHLVVYQDGVILLAAYDAGSDEVWLNRELSEVAMSQACDLLRGPQR
jgi:hypothetical protein